MSGSTADVRWRNLPIKTGDLVPMATVILDEVDRSAVVRRLATVAAAAEGDETAGQVDRIVELVVAREALMTSVVDDQIAFPHAVASDLGRSVVVVGLSLQEIRWDPTHPAVRVVALFVGDEELHLATMATMATLLRNGENRMALEGITSAAELDTAVSAALERTLPGESSAGDLTTEVVAAAVSLAGKLPGAVPAIVAGVFPKSTIPPSLTSTFRGFILGRPPGFSPDHLRIVTAVAADHADERSLERDVAHAALQGDFEGVQTLVVISGEAGSGRLSTMRVITLAEDAPGISVPGLDHVVTRRVERLAREIAREGREGKPVGCFFVVADPEEISGLTHQLIVNPFLGYPREERNVLDPSLEETIKEFSKIDGAFVIARDGTIESAGTYIAVNPQELTHRPGEGTRHASARAVTTVTEAIAVVVSESTGRVSIYARGNLVG
jgi:diadenylate cyclase